jgi:hypothetical protein
MQAIPERQKMPIVGVLVALIFAAHPALWVRTACAAPAGGEQAKSTKLFATEGRWP